MSDVSPLLPTPSPLVLFVLLLLTRSHKLLIQASSQYHHCHQWQQRGQQRTYRGFLGHVRLAFGGRRRSGSPTVGLGTAWLPEAKPDLARAHLQYTPPVLTIRFQYSKITLGRLQSLVTTEAQNFAANIGVVSSLVQL